MSSREKNNEVATRRSWLGGAAWMTVGIALGAGIVLASTLKKSARSGKESLQTLFDLCEKDCSLLEERVNQQGTRRAS